jgi:hypothetical protein
MLSFSLISEYDIIRDRFIESLEDAALTTEQGAELKHLIDEKIVVNILREYGIDLSKAK